MADPTDLVLGGEFPTPSRDEWMSLVEKVLKGSDFDKVLVTGTRDDIEIGPLYTETSAIVPDPGYPGTSPYLRGGTATVTAADGWEVRQAQVDPRPTDANESLLIDLARGVSGVLLRCDLATRGALAADSDGANHLVGSAGIAIHTVADLETVLTEVLLDIVPVHFEPGASFAEIAALYDEVVAKRGTEPTLLCGGFGADPIGAAAARGASIGGLDAAIASMGALARSTSERYPNMRAVQISTAPYANAGASEAQEIAYLAATGVAYLRAIEAAGLNLQQAAAQIELSVTVDADQFLSIAKLRAARQVWGRVLQACGVGDPMIRLHATMSDASITRRDPYVNMLRSTVACFAGAAGGADAITLAPFDAALGVPTSASRRIARNTHLVLREESGLGRVIDPAGGSWFVEELSAELASKAWRLFQAIEADGGMVAATTNGSVAAQIGQSRETLEKAIAKRRQSITGVSEFPNLDEALPEMPKVDYAKVAADTVSAVTAARADGQPVVGSSDRVPHEALPPFRPAQPFEDLRDRSDSHVSAHGRRPVVFLANLGPIAEHTARATFATNFFATGGVDVESNDGFATAAEAADSFAASDATVAVICSSDRVYEDLAEPTAKALADAGARRVYLAGRHQAVGVDEYVGVGVDAVAILSSLYELLEVTQ